MPTPFREPQTEQLRDGPASFTARIALISVITGSDAEVVDPVLDKVKTAALNDKEMIHLREQILNGFPNEKCNLQAALRPYWCVRDRLAIENVDGEIVMGSRVVIPKPLRAAILQDLVQMHQGATKLRQRARLSVYWPYMDVDIANASRSCNSATPQDTVVHPPAQIVFNKPMRDCLPAHHRSFAAEWQNSADLLEKRVRRSKAFAVEHFNKKAHPLEPMQIGQHVLIQHPLLKEWASPGVIIEILLQFRPIA